MFQVLAGSARKTFFPKSVSKGSVCEIKRPAQIAKGTCSEPCGPKRNVSGFGGFGSGGLFPQTGFERIRLRNKATGPDRQGNLFRTFRSETKCFRIWRVRLWPLSGLIWFLSGLIWSLSGGPAYKILRSVETWFGVSQGLCQELLWASFEQISNVWCWATDFCNQKVWPSVQNHAFGRNLVWGVPGPMPGVSLGELRAGLGFLLLGHGFPKGPPLNTKL